ncbi:hypothetical protein ACHMW4_04125 [Mesorhizobium sp. UC22_110]|uniref:hypothetical protein n=1 Tax=Mesorhizobium sp. UC22_110 TaxID=3374552 RepID=UPI0037563404
MRARASPEALATLPIAFGRMTPYLIAPARSFPSWAICVSRSVVSVMIFSGVMSTGMLRAKASRS